MIIGIKTKEKEIRGICKQEEVTLSGNKVRTIICEGIAARSFDSLIICCDACSKEFTYKRRNYFRNSQNRPSQRDLCETCRTKETSLQRYGVESPNQLGSVKQKQHNSDKEYQNGGFWKIRKTSSKEELSKIMSDKLKKQNEDPEFRKAYLEGAKRARQDPTKYLLTEEGRQGIIAGTIRANKQRWGTAEYREKMSKLRFRVSRFQMELYQEKLQQSSAWKLEYPIPNTRYTADLYNPETKEIIECYGDYWHCNPKKFAAGYYHKVVHKTAQEIWEYDNARVKDLENLGYKVSVIWESNRPKPPKRAMTN